MGLMGKEKHDKKTIWDAYAFSVSYTALTTLVGHPAERLKVAIQTNLPQNAFSVIKQFVGGSLSHFSTGFFLAFFDNKAKWYTDHY